MKRIKRDISLFLVLVMLFSCFQNASALITANAAGKIRLSDKKMNMVIGATKKIKISQLKNGKITYKSSNKSVATVSKKGKVKALKAGKVKIQIQAKLNNRKYILTYKVNVKKPTFKQTNITLGIGESITMALKNKPKSKAGCSYVWATKDSNIAKIQNGVVTGLQEGNTKVRVKITDGKHFQYYIIANVTVSADAGSSEEYTITFNSNGGSSVVAQTVKSGSSATKPTNPTRNGYSFEGWYTEPECINQYSFNDSVYGNVTLYAKWKSGQEQNNNSNQNDVNAETESVINAPDTVKAFDVSSEEGLKEVKQIANTIEEYWIDSGSTDSQNDDQYHMIVKETSPLYGLILDGTYKKDDIIYIPECEYFPVGSMLIYVSHDDVYPADHSGYDSTKYEHITTKPASITDIIDETAYIDYHTSQIDANNPVSFVWVPGAEDGTNSSVSMSMNDNEEYKLHGGINYTNQKLSAVTSNEDVKDVSGARYGSDEEVQGAGLQLQNLSKITPTASLEKFGLIMKDIVLYDMDGNKKTKTDRITLNGEVTLNDITPTVGIESKHSVLPQQIMATMEYTEKQNFNLTMGGKIGDTSKFLKAFKTEMGVTHNNIRKVLGMQIQGVDMSNSVILAAVGFNLTGAAPKVGIKSIRSQSIYMGVAPTLVVMVLLDLEGNISTTIVGEYSKTTYNKKGFNVQKKGFTGKYGTSEQNTGTSNYEVSGYNVNIYNVQAKSKTEQNVKPVSHMKISAAGEAGIKAGLGIGIGAMMAGIIVGQVKGLVVAEAKAKMDGSIEKWSDKDNLEIDGYGELDASLYLEAIAEVNLEAQNKKGEKEKGFGKTWSLGKYTLLEMVLTSRSLRGTVFASDQDQDASNDKVISGAKITVGIKGSTSANDMTAVTDSEGKFSISDVKDGETYKIKIEKDGYAVYEEEVKIDKNSSDLKFYLNSGNSSGSGSASLSGNVFEADTDTDISNNKSLSNVKVTITKSSTNEKRETVSDAQGKYSFNNLSDGLYELVFEKSGYISVQNQIEISSGRSMSNIDVELVSSKNAGEGTVKGVIYDSTTKKPVKRSITLEIYQGTNSTNTTVYKTIATDANGNYSVVLPAGNYTIVMRDKSSSPMYLDSTMNIKVLGNNTIENQNGTMIPKLVWNN